MRSSWLVLDTNCDLLSLACRSCRFFSSILSKSRTFSSAASCEHQKHPHCPRNPSFRVKTAPELIAYAKANPGKITMGSPFSVLPPSPNSRNSSSATTSSSRCGAEQRKALEKTRRGSSARSNSIGDGPQIRSTNHRHNFGQFLILNAGAAGGIVFRDLGQFVVTDEPVAVMGGGAQSAVAKAGGASQPVLYVEFRKDGIPVDPGPWWAANEGQKVRG